MLRIGICDDELNARDFLRLKLEQLLSNETGEIVYEFSSGNGAARWLKKHPGEIDLLFLDVEMKGLNGLETAKEIRTFNKDLIIVFVTGYADYVFDGYQVNAMDYILKPPTIERLNELLKRVFFTIEEKKDKVFVFKNVDGTFRIPLSDIKYFYSEKRLIHIKLDNQSGSPQLDHSFYEKLDNIEEQLKNKFIRIHQRYLINPDYVINISSNNVTLLDTNLPISRALKETATKKLAQALLEGSLL